VGEWAAAPDLLVIVPTRHRPGNVTQLIGAFLATRRASTNLILVTDEDDTSYQGLQVSPPVFAVVCPRGTCTEKINAAARRYGWQVPHLMFMGDDHLPVTTGWDKALLEAVRDRPGLAWPNDLDRPGHPQACLVSSPVVTALGWMAMPALHHYYIDNVWADLAAGADVGHYLPDVVIEHRHYRRTGEPRDQIYARAESFSGVDYLTYRRWKAERRPEDTARVRAAVMQP
jgi:hypothetical protein